MLRVKDCNCKFCGEPRTKGFLERHQKVCFLNPINLTECLNCGKPVKLFNGAKQTCSRSCSNTHFRSGRGNGNWKEHAYRSTCLLHHEKKCAICPEDRIIDVHHLDNNKKNNKPENLIPLCPTHHKYWHSRHRHLIEVSVYKYVEQWKKDNGV